MTKNMESKIKNLTRITPPKFKVGRRILNEYEMRRLQLDIITGEIEAGVKVYSIADGTHHVIDEFGMFDKTPEAYGLLSGITLAILFAKREKINAFDSQNNKAYKLKNS